jgi:hypothetical protein
MQHQQSGAGPVPRRNGKPGPDTKQFPDGFAAQPTGSGQGAQEPHLKPFRPARPKAERQWHELALSAEVEAGWPKLIGRAFREAVDRHILEGGAPAADRAYVRSIARRLAKRRSGWMKKPMSAEELLRALAQYAAR